MWIEVLVSTLGSEGLQRIARSLPHPMPEVTYLVSAQSAGPADVPAPLAARSDVRVIFNHGIGLSVNRNHALSNARGDILVIADDDLQYRPGAFAALREAYGRHPQADIMLVRHLTDTPTSKRYPAGETRLRGPRLPGGYYVTSFEITLRRTGRASALRFPECFGIGAPLGCGEEEVLVHRALTAGCEVWHTPLELFTHPGASTGRRRMTAPALRGAGATIAVMYPLTWPLRLPLKAVRLARSSQAPFATALRHLAGGAFLYLTRFRRSLTH